MPAMFTPLYPPALPASRSAFPLTSGSQLDRAATPTDPPGGAVVAGRFAGLTPTSGSSLDVAQYGAPWPHIIDGAVKWFAGWRARKPGLREVTNRNLPGNYGEITSQSNFQAKKNIYADGIGLYPRGIRGQLIPRTPLRPEWNNLVPIIWGLRVTDKGAQAQPGELMQVQRVQVGSTDYTPAGQANLREVLL